MKDLFKRESKKILIYISHEVENDPFDKSTAQNVLNSLPINAIVSDVVGESMKWKTGGIITSEGKKIICENKYRNLIEMSYKITVDNVDYQGYRINGVMSIKKLDSDFIRLYIYREK